MIDDNDTILAKARSEIDAIDDEIHALLVKRERAVSQVSMAKGGSGNGGKSSGNPVRFAREAQILRRLHGRHVQSGSHLSFMAVVRIWHELIAAYTLLQNHYEIAVAGADMVLARQQFGDSVQIYEANFGANKDSSQLWLLPHPRVGDWWLHLGGRQILACLPFVYEGEANMSPLAYVVGDCPSAFSSGDGSEDVICLDILCDGEISLDDDLVAVLAEYDICAIAVSGVHLYCERHGVSVDLPSYEAITGIVSITPLGTYAKPLAIK